MYADAGFGFSPYSPHPDFSTFFSPALPLPLLHQHHHTHPPPPPPPPPLPLLHQHHQQQQHTLPPPPGPGFYDHPAMPLTIDHHLGSMGQASLLSEYDLGGEGDLFKAPEPIIEESLLSLQDPAVAAAMSMMSSGGEPSEMDESSIKVDDPLLSEVLYECEKELMEKSAIEETISELLDVKIPMLQVEQVLAPPAGELLAMDKNDKPSSLVSAECSLQKSVSSGCLNSADWMNGSAVRPNFLDFQGLDFETAFGLRRAYSEGDIQNMGANSTPRPGNTGNVETSCERLVTISDLKTEERKQKLSRYRKKKVKRNFGRKIKYACRKALADSQPRVRGRFAKMDDGDMLRPRK